VKGRAKLFLSHENGRVSLISFLDAPCFIGEIELLGAQTAARGVIAITRCECYAIRIERCKDQLLKDTTFLRYLCLFLSKKSIDNTNNFSQNLCYSLETRLANFILTTSHNGIYREKHTEVAEYLGVTYRHLLYVIAKLVKSGILEKTAQGYLIKNEHALRKMATIDNRI
jgi:CRP-like cAMP-binding protein